MRHTILFLLLVGCGAAPTNEEMTSAGPKAEGTEAAQCACIPIPEGAEGPEGPEGPAGERGPQGDRGAEGDRGATGEPGTAGLDGMPGPKGDPGDEGNQGPVGPMGLQGIQGLKGNTGSTGLKGDPGADGRSFLDYTIYKVAASGSSTGTWHAQAVATCDTGDIMMTGGCLTKSYGANDVPDIFLIGSTGSISPGNSWTCKYRVPGVFTPTDIQAQVICVDVDDNH